MPPKDFQKPKLNGEIVIRYFDARELEIRAKIKKGELVESVDNVAAQLNVIPKDDSPFCLVDEQQLIITTKLFDGHEYFLTGGEIKRKESQGQSNCNSHPPDAAVAWVYHPDMLKHDPENHRSPETSHRLLRAIEMLQQCQSAEEILPKELRGNSISPSGKTKGLSYYIPPRLATNEEIFLFQSKQVYEKFLTEGAVLENLKSDVYCNPMTSSRAVKLSVGGIIDASSLIWSNIHNYAGEKGGTKDIFSSFCLVRPPGHHCTSERPSGFCLVNNVCIATQNLIEHHTVKSKGGLSPRIAILDLDVHFGEGIAEYVDRFKKRSNEEQSPLLYLSVHRYDAGSFYPFESKGSASFVGEQNKGSIFNMAVDTHSHISSQCEAVISDFLLEKLMTELILPKLESFAPDMVFVSMGFDAAYGDPLGKMAVEGGFCRSTALLKQWCNSKRSGSRPPVGLIVALEGGYSPEAVAQGVLHVAYTLTYPINHPLVEENSRSRIPRTWNELRQKQERKFRQWKESEQREDERPELVAEADDAVLLEKHKKWCESQIKSIDRTIKNALK